MKALIGNALLLKLKPSDKQYDVRDTKLIGFLIRVNPSGKMMYVCEYQRGRRVSLGKVGVLTPAQARDKALAILGNAAQGIDPQGIDKKKTIISLQEFIINEYAPWVKQHRKAGVRTLAHINRCFVKFFGNKSLTEITPVLIEQWRTQRLKDGLSTETVNRDIGAFKAALSKAVLWGFIETHPLAKLKLLKVDRIGKIRFLSADEEKRLRQAMKFRDEKIKIERQNGNQWRKERDYTLYPDLSKYEFADYLSPMVLLSINTGLRRGELFSLQWQNINFEQAILTIVGDIAKSGKTRHVPLNLQALHVLKTWREQTASQELVFSKKDGKPFDNVKKSWTTLLRSAGIENFRWHDLRHHFASRLVMVGVDLNTVRELLGHSDLAMTLRYAHLAPEHKANAVAKLIEIE
ncbi:MAG: site specific recombinase [Gammaproteobacteria bacterium]|jgi:integrase|nr:site specific recombinase [Gammaproteobacteria bacterium]